MESNIGQLPPSEKKNSLLRNQWRSSYNQVALETLKKVTGENAIQAQRHILSKHTPKFPHTIAKFLSILS